MGALAFVVAVLGLVLLNRAAPFFALLCGAAAFWIAAHTFLV